MEVVGQAVREKEQEVAGADPEPVALAVLGGVQGHVRHQPPLQRLRRPEQLEGAVPRVLLLLRPRRDVQRPLRVLPQEHEARVAKVCDASHVALDAEHADRRRAVSLDLRFRPTDGGHRKLVGRTVPRWRRGPAARLELLGSQTHQLGGVRRRIHTVFGKHDHLADSIGHAHAMRPLEIRVLAPALWLGDLVRASPQPERLALLGEHPGGNGREIPVFLRVSVQIATQAHLLVRSHSAHALRPVPCNRSDRREAGKGHAADEKLGAILDAPDLVLVITFVGVPLAGAETVAEVAALPLTSEARGRASLDDVEIATEGHLDDVLAVFGDLQHPVVTVLPHDLATLAEYGQFPLNLAVGRLEVRRAVPHRVRSGRSRQAKRVRWPPCAQRLGVPDN
mmetsp:Transcript_85372/g.261080  ORF Transcript_85372/g.261080 Transcript_85372/m.261080 type:complete len:394 (+) Transcript_85372:416-1597(+)